MFATCYPCEEDARDRNQRLWELVRRYIIIIENNRRRVASLLRARARNPRRRHADVRDRQNYSWLCNVMRARAAMQIERRAVVSREPAHR